MYMKRDENTHESSGPLSSVRNKPTNQTRLRVMSSCDDLPSSIFRRIQKRFITFSKSRVPRFAFAPLNARVPRHPSHA